jgi:hypothetical protein
MRELAGAEAGLTGALGRLLAVAEAYPDLKANQNMMQLTEELTSTENKVAFARQAYNDSVMAYNTKREVFPTNIVAGIFNFAAAELFQVDNAAERQAPNEDPQTSPLPPVHPLMMPLFRALSPPTPQGDRNKARSRRPSVGS